MIVYHKDRKIGEINKDLNRDCWNCWHYDSDETFEMWNVGIAEAREAVIHVDEEHRYNNAVAPLVDPCRAKVHELIAKLESGVEGDYWNKEYIVKRLREVLQ